LVSIQRKRPGGVRGASIRNPVYFPGPQAAANTRTTKSQRGNSQRGRGRTHNFMLLNQFEGQNTPPYQVQLPLTSIPILILVRDSSVPDNNVLQLRGQALTFSPVSINAVINRPKRNNEDYSASSTSHNPSIRQIAQSISENELMRASSSCSRRPPIHWP
jgi:hypothetical protein